MEKTCFLYFFHDQIKFFRKKGMEFYFRVFCVWLRTLIFFNEIVRFRSPARVDLVEKDSRTWPSAAPYGLHTAGSSSASSDLRNPLRRILAEIPYQGISRSHSACVRSDLPRFKSCSDNYIKNTPTTFQVIRVFLVRIAGLEPVHLSALEPKSSVSANSTISANYFDIIYEKQLFFNTDLSRDGGVCLI